MWAARAGVGAIAALVVLASMGGPVQASPNDEAAPDSTIIILGDYSRVADKFGVRGEHRDRARVLAETPFLTVVHADEHVGDAVADALATVVSAQVRRLGGMGAFATLSLRGLAPGNTSVIIDHVPASRIASVTVDVAQWELGQFERIEVYRGGAPAHLGGGGGSGLGGALHLISPVGRSEDGDRVAVMTSVGAWGTRRLRAWVGDDAAWGRYRVSGGIARARGDFSYFDDRGTMLNRDDDVWRARENNGVAMGDLSLRVASRVAEPATPRATWRVGLRGATRAQGLAGNMSSPAAQTQLATSQLVFDATASKEFSPRWRGQGTAFASGEHQRYRDPAGEVGVGVQDRTYRTGASGTQVTATASGARYRVDASLALRGERFTDRDNLDQARRLDGSRLGGSATLQLAAQLTSWLIIEPSLGVERLHTSSLLDLDTREPAAARRDTFATPRLAMRALATSELQAKASVGGYARTPTLIELFGDRGLVWGNPGLSPETGQSADAGIVWAPAAPARGLDRVLVEAAAFVATAHDTIVWASTNGYVMRPINLGEARLSGLELSWHARLARRVVLAGNYTHLATRQRDTEPSYEGKPLPQRPRHQAYARVDIALHRGAHPVVAMLDVAHASGSYLDAAAAREVPARTLLGAALTARVLATPAHTLDVALHGYNLTNLRVEHLALASPPSPEFATVPRAVMDTAGFPLPGRSWMFSASWHY
ncbi:MAG: TonB-dependent receptor [Myxococcales bacterium]|nr:TonB-dependent receptor [Myxococcales bacterium]